ncbi:MAG TPA: hypothetical protein QGH10_25130 [Armatimonadota bacterium]|nr:hypothetical protein [Armatimonadota bacterium]
MSARVRRPPPPLSRMGEGCLTLAEMPKIRRIPIGLVRVLVAGGLIGGPSLFFAALCMPGALPSYAWIPFCLLVTLIYLVGWATWLYVVHGAWSAIQDGQARVGPARAVGLLLAPVYNVYWIFPAVYGLSQDWNRFASRHATAGLMQNERVFLAQASSMAGSLACTLVALAARVAAPGYLAPLLNTCVFGSVLLGLAATWVAVKTGTRLSDGVNDIASTQERALGDAPVA